MMNWLIKIIEEGPDWLDLLSSRGLGERHTSDR